MANDIATGFTLGTGAAQNVKLGWLPDVVILSNLTDGDIINVWHRANIANFTAGAANKEIKAGDIVQGATTTTARARVKQILLVSGTWAGGDAAGYIVFDQNDMTGTFAAGGENLNVLGEGSSVSGGGGIKYTTAAALAAGSPRQLGNLGITTAAASVTPANGIQPYLGSFATDQAGFTITATASESGKLLAWVAMRGQWTLA